MQPEPEIPRPPVLATAGGVPPPLPIAPPPAGRSASQQFLVFVLSAGLGLFLVDGIVSLLDDTLIVFTRAHLLSGIRGLVFLSAALMLMLIYGLMGLTVTIPKRVFVPLTLFMPAALLLLIIPGAIYLYRWLPQISWGVSLCQVLFGFVILRWLQRGRKWSWLPVPAAWVPGWRFSWGNLLGFVAVNAFILLPVVGLYLAVCASRTVHHYSHGFLALRQGGLTVQVRKYVRSDGKTIQLIPMSHVGESSFYRELWQSFPTNSTILMEGVTDEKHLLTNKISYERMARSIGLTEQKKEFTPLQGELVPADVDVSEFAPSTLEYLNLVMLIHSQGVSLENLLKLLQLSPTPEAQARLFDDLLQLRNRHLLGEIRKHLLQSDHLIVPWGALHIPGIAEELEKSGFAVAEMQEHLVIRFRSVLRRRADAAVLPP